MYNNDDLTVLNSDDDLESGFDDLDPLEEELPQTKPDPEAMLLLLKSADNQQRMMAARAFCEIEEARAIPYLISMLSEPCPLSRVSAAYALGRNPSEDAVLPLINLFDQELNGYVRKGVVWALGNSRDLRCLSPLISALKTDIPAVRLWASTALAQMAKLRYEHIFTAIPALIEALRLDTVAAVRSNCAWSLGQFCRELPSNGIYAGAIDGLIDSLESDPDLGVREDAKSALLKVGDPRGLQAVEGIPAEDDFLDDFFN
jgi:HEAT repeat protein